MKESKKFLKSEKSKRQIINATIHLMATRGYGQTSIADISNATGLTKGALYHHFSSKEDLFEVSIRYITDIIGQNLLKIDSASGSSAQILGHVFDIFINLFEEDNHYVLIVCSLVLEMESGRTSFAQPLTEMFSKFSTYLERIIVKGQSNHEFAADIEAKLVSLNIVGVLFGSSIPWIMNKDRTNYRAIMESQKNILLNSIKNS
jgi:AcrR family transcriptional regulator